MIQIDMPMPDNCLECRFNTSEFGYCNAMPIEFVGQVSDFEEDGKPEWCPLKGQEPRVMALEELPDWDGAFLIETRVKATVWASWYSEYELYGETVCRMVDIGGEVDDRLKKRYGYEWRCWTSKPDKATREGTPWE